MWPWEHAAFAYLLYSSLARLADEPVGDLPVIVLAGASLLPDLIDKPLGWQFGLYPTGYGAAHSLVVAVPAVVLLATLCIRYSRPHVGAAFAVGYGAHLVGDAIDPLRSGGFPRIDRLLWPFSSLPSYERERTFFERLTYYLGEFLSQGFPPEHVELVALYVFFLGGVAALWVADGAPGLRPVVRLARRAVGDGR